MARIRFLKPEFFKHPGLADLPIAARMFFAGLWCQADREGRLKDRPKSLKLEIAPWDDIDADQILAQLADHGFVTRYAVGGERFIQIHNFGRHQRPHPKEPESEIPPPGSPTPPYGSGNGESRQDTAKNGQSVANPPDSGSLGSGVLDSGLVGRDPPVSPPVGGKPPAPLRLRKRNRSVTTLEEDLIARRDSTRNDRSKMLHEQLARVGGAMPRDEQIAWVQGHCRASPEEAADVVALVESARLKAQNGEVRHAR